LPFYNESGQAMAAGAARDALFYALSDRGFRMHPFRETDRKLSDRSLAGSLRRDNGSLDAQAAGRIFGSDLVAVGRVLAAAPHNAGPVGLSWLKLQVWLMDTRTGEILWSDTASGLVRVFDRPRLPQLRGRPEALSPSEQNQKPLLRLCRSFDALAQRMARAVPSLTPEPEVTQLAIGRLDVRTPRPVVSSGDPIEILVEATQGCVARATLGTLGTTVTLEESGRGQPTGLYRGSYTVQPGDSSTYCRVAVTVQSGTSRRRLVAPARSAFMIDAVPPLPPTGLACETQLGGVFLTWDPSASPDVVYYQMFRSDATTAGVRALARPLGTSYLDRMEDDRAARLPHHYVYFVKAMDSAGNPSSSSVELAFDMPARGPSTVGGVIEGEARWTAYGSPYRLALDVDVAPGGHLVIEPGAEIEIPPGMEITVRGTAEAVGRANEPIKIVGTKASRGFHVAHPKAVLRAAYVEISGTQRGAVEVADGECYLDQVTLHDNRTGLDAQTAKRLALGHSTLLRNRYGVVAGANSEIRACDFIQNEVGLRAVSDGLILEGCLFDNTRLDIEKLGGQPLVADDNTFWTADPAALSGHLWGNVVCRRIFVKRWLGRGDRPVQFDTVAACLARAETAAFDGNWEEALRGYEAALVQERNRDIIDKALKVFKSIVDTHGLPGLEREIDFCRSAVLAYPRDVKLLRHLADLYSRQANMKMANEIYARILKIDPKDEVAKKSLAASASKP
jgi:hypothetical protein